MDDRKFHYRINEASDDGSPVQTRRNELVRRSEILSWAGGMQDIHPDETSVPPVSIATAGSQDSTSFLEGPLMCKYTIADGKVVLMYYISKLFHTGAKILLIELFGML